jgi:PAS domain S-box-containing protein
MSESHRLFRLIVLFLGLLLIVPLIAFGIVQLNGPEIRKHAFVNLNAVANLKASEIENWLAERQIDLEFLSAAEEFARHAERLVLTSNADSRAFVLRRLEAYSKSRFYHSAILLNASGQVAAAAGESNDASAPVTQQLLQAALKSGQMARSDLYQDASTGHVHLDYILPLRGTGGRQPVAAVLLHVPAERFLFPHIHSWPTPSPSAETVLVRRDGNDVLFLNELRHRPGAALSLRLPLDATNVPAVAAVLSDKAQVMEGVDYRGVAVFSATRPIAGTPWHLVAKIDREEVMAPLKELIFWVSLLALFAVTTVSIAIWRLWRQMWRSQQLELAAQAAAIELKSEAKYRRLHESMIDPYVMVDMSGRLLEFNQAYLKMLGHSDEELRRLTYVDLTPEKWHEIEARIVAEQIIPHGQSIVYEKEYIRKDGSVFPVELRVSLLRDKNGQPEAMWAIVRDITERKQAENELRIAAIAFESQDGMAITDANRVILRVNRAFTSITGYTADEAVSKTPLMLKSDHHDEAFYEAIWENVNNTGEWEGEIWNRRKNGETYLEYLTVTAVKNANGSVVNYVFICKDITESKRNEEELKIFFDLIPELVCVASADGRFLKINAMWQEVLGYTEAEILATPFLEFIHPDDRDTTMKEVEKQLAGNATMHFINRYRCKDGSYRWLEWGAAPAVDGKLLFAAARDITERLLMERTLSESEQHFRTLANSGSTLIWTSKQDKLCDYFNEPWLRFTGRTLEQELGNGWAEDVHPDDFERCLDTYVTAFDHRKPFSMEYRLRQAEGSYRWIRDDGNPRYDSQGEFLGYIGFCVDVTEQKELAAELERHHHHLEELVDARTRDLAQANSALGVEIVKLKKAEEKLDAFNRDFEAFLDQTTDFIYFKDINSRFRFCSRTLAAITGHKDWHEMLGKHDREVFPPDTARIYEEEEVPVLAEGKPLLNKIDPYYDSEGCLGYVQTNKWPLFDATGKVAGIFGISRDITERMAASQALKDAKDAAEAANRAKSVFLANMSHELRTPLNAILGFSDILRRAPGLSEGQRQNLAIIHKSGDHLLGLINDVLDIAKIEAGRIALELAPFDFSGMILDITDMLRLRAEEKGLKLQVDQSSEFPRYLVGDEAKLRQILINLISNAIKATAEGGVILRLELKHDHADHLLIEVEDSGCGIAPAEQARILEPFVQIGPQNKQQGTGLGLAITRQFVELMGGSLSLASTVGQGSTFRVDIPVQLAQPEDIPPAPQTRGEVTGLEPGQPACRVLVVEDQLESQLLLVYLLEDVGFDVRLAENGAEAVEQFQSWRPHLIWMDRRMPVMDGVEATRRIRALPGGEAVKITAVTASSFREEDEELMAAGFDAIVHKPFRSEQIFESMEHLLGLRFVRAEAEAEAKPWSELSPAAMAALPAPLRQDLAEALVILDSERILEVVDKIAAIDPVLATALRERVQNYNYEPILALLQSGSRTSGENESGALQGEKPG